MSDYSPPNQGYQQPAQPFNPAPPPAPKKSRTTLWILLGVGLFGLAIICAGIALFAWNSLGRKSSIPELVGADTQVYFTFQPALSDLPNIQRLQAAYPDLFIDDPNSQVSERLEDELDINFKEDILPWVDKEMAVAITGISDYMLEGGSLYGDFGNEVAEDADVTFIIASRDDKQAQAFLDKVRTQLSAKGNTFSDTTHDGTTIVEVSDKDGKAINAYALLKGNVVLASTPELVKAVIDRAKSGENTLKDNPHYQDVRASLPESAIAHFYINGTLLNGAMAASLEEGLEDVPPAQAKQLEDQLELLRAVNGVGLSVSVEAEGIKFDGSAKIDQASLGERARQNLEAQVAALSGAQSGTISNEAVAFMSFRIPTATRELLSDMIFESDEGVETAEMLYDQFGIDIQKDLLDWFEGEAAIVVVPGGELGDVTLPVSGYFSIKPLDIEAAQAGMENIRIGLEDSMQGALVFEEQSLGGSDWFMVVEPGSGIGYGGYGILDGAVVIGIAPNSLEAAGEGKNAPISADPRFTTVQNALGSEHNSMLYINVGGALDAAEANGVDLAELDDDVDLEKNLRPIKAIGLTGKAGISEKGIASSSLFILIEAE
jgi:hypothetical protein